MSDNEKNQYNSGSESDNDAGENQPLVSPEPNTQKNQGNQQRQRTQTQNQNQNQGVPWNQQQNGDNQVTPMYGDQRLTGNMGGRTGAIRESRIKDRPQPKETRDSSLKVKIELDLEVEVDLYARVKGDVTIGLM
ncbi:hypothetical protein B7463_g4896, partial [Scytalidium lignicola]